MTAQRSFQLAAKAEVKAEEAKEYRPLDYEFVSADGEKRILVATYPGDGALTLLVAATGTDSEELDMVGALFGFLGEAFSEDDTKFLRRQIRESQLSLAMLMELVQDMMEVWTTFPTKSSSASSTSPVSTGTRSTGRVHSKAVKASSDSLPDAG